MVIIESPIKARLVGYEKKPFLKSQLTYTNLALNYEIKRVKNGAHWLVPKLGQEGYEQLLEDLKKSQKQCLVFEDERGLWTYSGLAPKVAQLYQDQIINNIQYPESKLVPWDKFPFDLRPYQKTALEALLKAKHGSIEYCCHRKGEKILLFNGRLKKVEDLCVGDQLMGPDSKPRNILELKTGFDAIYKIETTNGQTMYVNGHHVLHLKRTNRSNRQTTFSKRRKDYLGKNPEINITVNDYLKQSKAFKHVWKTYTVPITFTSQDTPIDPYILGLLLGDGSIINGVNLTTADNEIANHFNTFVIQKGGKIRVSAQKNNKSKTYHAIKSPELFKNIKDLRLWGCNSDTKFIPDIYKINDRNVQLRILAGLIDTDGYKAKNYYEFVSKSEKLANDVCFISRSLGYRATIKSTYKKSQTGNGGIYYRVTISGNLSEIPVILKRKQCAPRKQIKNVNMFGFSVIKVAENEQFYGFTLDNDHLYLTDTFLVTQNSGAGKTLVLLYLAKSLGLKTVVVTPSISIADQVYNLFTTHFSKKYVGKFYQSKKEIKLFTIAVSNSLIRLHEGEELYEKLSGTEVLLFDESHLAAAETLSTLCFNLFKNTPYRFFVSGTQIRNDGLDLLLEAIIGPIQSKLTVKDLVDQGFLARPEFYMVEIESHETREFKETNDYTRHYIYYNQTVNRNAAEIANKMAGKGKQVLILIEEIEQFGHILPHLKYQTKFVYGKGSDKNVPTIYKIKSITPIVQQFNNKDFPILVGTSAVSTGTDFTTVDCIIYLMGGASEIQVRQAVGRGTRRSPGKDKCLFFDFDIINIDKLHRHGNIRKRIYKEIIGNVEIIGR